MKFPDNKLENVILILVTNLYLRNLFTIPFIFLNNSDLFLNIIITPNKSFYDFVLIISKHIITFHFY